MAIRRNYINKYVVKIFNYIGQQIYTITSQGMVSLEYSRELNEVGTFSMALIGEQAEWVWANMNLPIGLDYFVEIYRLNPMTFEYEKDDTYFTRFVNPYHTDDGTFFIVVGGFSLNRLLMYRLIVPDEDPIGAGGYVTDAGKAGKVIARLVEAHLGNMASSKRQITNLITDYDGTGELAGGRWRFDNLHEICKELANAGGVRFNIEHTGEARLVMRIGTWYHDKTLTTNFPGKPYALFSRQRGNLNEPSLILDYKEEKNVVYLRGSGNEDNQVIIVQEAVRMDNSPYNRIEFEQTSDRDDERESPTIMLTQAKDALVENAPKIEFTFPVQDLPGTLYKVDYDLGDKVSAIWGEFKNDLVVSSINLSIQEGEETLNVSVESEDIGKTT